MLLFYRLQIRDMNNNRSIVNINGNGQVFPHLIEYVRKHSDQTKTNGSDVNWSVCEKNNECIHLLSNHVPYYRHKNDWYTYSNLEYSNQYIPEHINTSKIRIHIPNHSISAYKRGAKYAISVHTYINGIKIDLGSFIFKPTDTIANKYGKIKYGNVEYMEYFEFYILDPYYITYSDDWVNFRHNICGEPLGINSTGSILSVSLYSVDEYDGRYLMDKEYAGGIAMFNISDIEEFLALDLSYYNGDSIKLNISYNSEYNWLLTYLKETYNINCSHKDIKFEIVLKTKDAIGAIANIDYNATEMKRYGKATQVINRIQLTSNSSYSQFFDSWENFSEGWNFVASMIIYDEDYELFSIVSNELPITQEDFSRFVNGGSEKIIDLNDMEIKNYNVVNKIVNEIIQVERPNNSKSNIIQPVFFRVKETELLTLHPAVTENICINLDDYKSKVNKFTLMIDGVKFKQIGANNYGVIFKVIGNKISTEQLSGIYYILDDNMELVTSGKYNCVI